MARVVYYLDFTPEFYEQVASIDTSMLYQTVEYQEGGVSLGCAIRLNAYFGLLSKSPHTTIIDLNNFLCFLSEQNQFSICDRQTLHPVEGTATLDDMVLADFRPNFSELYMAYAGLLQRGEFYLKNIS